MRTNPVLAKLPPEVIVAIENIATISQVKNGGILWEQGDASTYFYIVITGRLRKWQSIPTSIMPGLQKEIGPGEQLESLVPLSKKTGNQVYAIA